MSGGVKLKPCPFCGSREMMLFCDPAEGLDNSGPSRRIQCAGCNIEAPFYDTEAEAREQWNRRAPASPASPDREGKQGFSSSRDPAPTADAACVAEATTLVPGEETGWQPIRTAPKDGTWFLAIAGQQVRVVHYGDRHDRLPISHPGVMWNTLPTHWHPLPAPLSEPVPLNPLVPGEVKP